MRNTFLKSRRVLYMVFILGVGLLVILFYPRSEGLSLKEVIDGDTIILSNGEKIRYIGINTPDKGQPFFSEATKASLEMLSSKLISLKYDVETKDNTGRTLAYVWVDSLFVNAELIKRGLAWVYIVSPNLAQRETFISLQKEARQKRIGIWAIPVPKEKHYVATKESRKFIFHRPSCKWAQKILDKNRITFKSRDEALDLGYSPCRTCNP